MKMNAKGTLIDLMSLIEDSIRKDYATENTCGSYENAKKHVRKVLDLYGLRLVTDRQVTMIVNRNWRTA